MPYLRQLSFYSAYRKRYDIIVTMDIVEYLYSPIADLKRIRKIIIRIFLSISFLPIVRRFLCIQHAISKVTNGRVDFKTLMYKIGDQPVLGDVMLIIARPI